MRSSTFWVGLLLLTALVASAVEGCGAATFTTGRASPSAEVSSTAIPPAFDSATPVASALSISITPDSDQSFRQVAGRAPFAVNFGATIVGGIGPLTYEWDFEGSGNTNSREPRPGPFVYQRPGEYQATLTVHDGAGQTGTATRRIVVLADSSTLPSWKYGVTAHLERRRAGYYPDLADVERACALAQAAGIQSLRIDFNWDMLNPVARHWKFDDYDAMVRIVRAHKLDILGIVDYSSWWASSAQDSNDWRVRLYSEPISNYEFARYAYEIAAHFKHDIHVWQIWNEPNTQGFWKPKPDAAHYTQLLQEAYLAVKYANPQAVVIFAGLSGNGVDGDDQSGLASNFIESAYAAGAKNYFDVMAIHPYILPNSGIATVRSKIAAARAVMDKHGDQRVPLWLTEIGAPSDAPWWPTAPLQSEEAVGAWLEQVYTRLWDLTPVIFWYDLQDQGIGDPAEQRFGLLHLDFSLKPAYERYRTLTGK